MISIIVINQSTGKPMKGIRVGVSIGNDGTYHEYTNEAGETHFSRAELTTVTDVFVDGQPKLKRLSQARNVVYL